MKTLICLLGIGLLVSQNVFCKKITDKELPAAVRDSFVYTFPLYKNITEKVNWYTFNYSEYYAKFRINGKFATAVFAKDGRCIETSILVNVRHIPANILESLRALYPGYDISRAEDVISNTDARYYRLTVTNGKKEILVVMDYSCGIIAEKNVMPE